MCRRGLYQETRCRCRWSKEIRCKTSRFCRYDVFILIINHANRYCNVHNYGTLPKGWGKTLLWFDSPSPFSFHFRPPGSQIHKVQGIPQPRDFFSLLKPPCSPIFKVVRAWNYIILIWGFLASMCTVTFATSWKWLYLSQNGWLYSKIGILQYVRINLT